MLLSPNRIWEDVCDAYISVFLSLHIAFLYIQSWTYVMSTIV
jgi:hypothetical protein